MTLTRQKVADQFAAYLHHDIRVAQLVDSAERALMESDLDEPDAKVLAYVLARLGVADVKAFGLTWEDCEALLTSLGYSPRVDVVAIHDR